MSQMYYHGIYGPNGWINEYKECEDVKKDNDESAGQVDGWES